MICDIDLDDVEYESDANSVIFNDVYDETESDNYSRALSFISDNNSFSFINSYLDKNYSKSYDVSKNSIYINSGKRQRSDTIESDNSSYNNVIYGYSYNDNYLHIENIHLKNINNMKNKLVSFKKKNTKLKYKLVLQELKLNKIIEENNISQTKLKYKNVLDELLKKSFEIKSNKVLYSTIIEEINKKKVYEFGKMYLKFVNSL
jgi:hypothetical protein